MVPSVMYMAHPTSASLHFSHFRVLEKAEYAATLQSNRIGPWPPENRRVVLEEPTAERCSIDVQSKKTQWTHDFQGIVVREWCQ